MKRFLFLVALVCIGIGSKRYLPQLLSKGTLPSLTQNVNDPCLGKKMCGVVYIAPWCPACEQISSFLQHTIDNSLAVNEYGFLLIVGAGDPQQNENKAKSFSANTFVDADLALSKALGISYYPSFFVLDAYRKIKLRDQDAMNWMQEQFHL